LTKGCRPTVRWTCDHHLLGVPSLPQGVPTSGSDRSWLGGLSCGSQLHTDCSHTDMPTVYAIISNTLQDFPPKLPRLLADVVESVLTQRSNQIHSLSRRVVITIGGQRPLTPWQAWGLRRLRVPPPLPSSRFAARNSCRRWIRGANSNTILAGRSASLQHLHQRPADMLDICRQPTGQISNCQPDIAVCLCGVSHAMVLGLKRHH